MKKLLLALFVVACGTTLSAQTSISSESKTVSVKSKEGKEDKQIKEALTENKELQDATIKHFESDEKTKDTMAKISQENQGDTAGMIKSILGNKQLSKMAVDYIKDNPELLKKAMSVVGM